jgi:TetR/AcrR family transcriptional regulator
MLCVFQDHHHILNADKSCITSFELFLIVNEAVMRFCKSFVKVICFRFTFGLTIWLHFLIKSFNQMNKTKDTTEEKILNAAKEVFMKYGLYGARMQDIADTAKINKALLHYYFRSKEKLFDHVFSSALHKYFEQIDVFSDSSLPIKARLFKYIDNIFAFLEEYPQMSMFIIKEISINPDLFKEKIDAIKNKKGISCIKILDEEIELGNIKKIDTALFWINMHSLCSYPFLAAPLFKHTLKVHHKDWQDYNPAKIKQSVKQFIEKTLGI